MKKLAVTFAAAILGVGIVAVHLWKELHAEREKYASLHARVAELEGARNAVALAAATPAFAPAPGAAAAQATAGPGIAPATPAPDKARSSAQRGPTDAVAGALNMMASPEGKEMMRTQMRAELARQFPDLASELNLTPAEADRFFELLAKQASDSTGDALAMFGGGDNAAMQESQRKLLERQQTSDAELAAMLGSKYPRWQEYQGTVSARQQVSQLRALLGSGENALSEAQSRPLVAALGAETARISQDSRSRRAAAAPQTQNMLETQLQETAEQNQRLIKVASPHLTAPQLDGYRRLLTQQETMIRMMLGTMNGQKNAPAQGGATR